MSHLDLEMEEFSHSADYKRIFNFHGTIPDRIVAREGSQLEFKESFNWLAKEQYAKSMAAFANNRGGYVVFGVSNRPRTLVGLRGGNFDEKDESVIAEYLNSAFSPEICFEKFSIEMKGKKVGLIYTLQATNKPVLCTKNGSDIKESDIYYRYNARSEKIKYSELFYLLEQLREVERKNWMDHFAKISKIGPSNAAVLDMLNGKITGSSGTLVIDESLLPKLRFIKEGSFKEREGLPTLKLIGDVKPVTVVGYKKQRDAKDKGLKITDDPSAPIVRVEEETVLRSFPLSYSALVPLLRNRFSDFKTDASFHSIKRKLMENKNLYRPRYLDPNKPEGTKKDFFSRKIIEEFDRYYSKKRTRITSNSSVIRSQLR